jgi:hypothetical protein
MLVRLSQQQISRYWDFIEIALKLSSIPTVAVDDGRINSIHESLLKGLAICWVEGDDKSPRTVLVTSLKTDPVSETRNLMLYCVHGFRKASSEEYVEMIRSLGLYAKGLRCDHIISYVSNPGIIKLLRKYGALVEYSLVVFPLR